MSNSRITSVSMPHHGAHIAPVSPDTASGQTRPLASQEATHPARDMLSTSGSAMRMQLQGRMMTNETKQAIINDVVHAFTSWDHSKSIHVRRHFLDLTPNHVLIALIFDAIYKRHCGSQFSVHTLPIDNDVKGLLDGTFDALLQIELPQKVVTDLKEIRNWDFEPHLHETLINVLGEEFDQTPHLRDIAEEHRGRLLVDRLKLDILEKHGIDGGNPLLASLFNFEPKPAKGYGLHTARGWVAAMRTVDQPFTTEKAHEVHAIASPDSRIHEICRFGAFASKGGLEELAESMHLFSTYGITSFFINNDSNRCYIQTPQYAREMAEVRESTLPVSDLMVVDGTKYHPVPGREAKTVKELMADEPDMAADRQMFQLHRTSMQELNDADRKAKLDMVIADFMKPVDGLLEKLRACGDDGVESGKPSRNEIFECLARIYLRLEHLHAKGDGNCRLWGSYGLNIWGIQAGLGMSLIENPNEADGCSVQQLAKILEDGEEFCSFLRKDFRDRLEGNSPAYFKDLVKHVDDGDLPQVRRMLTVARLYPKQGPGANEINDLLRRAIEGGQSSQIKIALTEFPSFDAGTVTQDGRKWLSLAAAAGDMDLCSRLLCMGSDPGGVESSEKLDKSIAELLEAARILRRSDRKLEAYDYSNFTPLFRVFKSYDLPALKEMILPELSKTSPVDFILDSLKDDLPLTAFAAVAVAKAQLDQQVKSMAPADLKARMQKRQQDGKPLLMHLIVRKYMDASVFSYLACLAELPISDALKLDILMEKDSRGNWALHQAVANEKSNVANGILDLIDRLNIPQFDKLNAIMAKNDKGAPALEDTSSSAVADRILSELVGSAISDMEKFDALASSGEDGLSILHRLIEADNTELVEKITSSMLELGDIPDMDKAALVLEMDEFGAPQLPDMEKSMQDIVMRYLSQLDLPENYFPAPDLSDEAEPAKVLFSESDDVDVYRSTGSAKRRVSATGSADTVIGGAKRLRANPTDSDTGPE